MDNQNGDLEDHIDRIRNMFENQRQENNENNDNQGAAGFEAQMMNRFRSFANLLNDTIRNGVDVIARAAQDAANRLEDLALPLNNLENDQIIQERRNYTPDLDNSELVQLPRRNEMIEFLERDKFDRVLEKIAFFNGESDDSLKRFIASATIAEGRTRTDEKRVLLIEDMIRKVPTDLISIVKQYNGENWSDVIHAINAKYAHLHKNGDLLRAQIENLKQSPNETLSAYAERARKLVRERCALFRSEDMHSEINAAAARMFKKGIANTKIREIALNRATNSLESAIKDSFEVEADSQAVSIPNEDKYCRFCKTTGHTTSECKKKPKDGDELAKVVAVLSTLNVQQNSNRNGNSNNNSSNGYRNNSNQGERGGNGQRFQRNNSNYNNNRQNTNRNNRSNNWNGQRNGNSYNNNNNNTPQNNRGYPNQTPNQYPPTQFPSNPYAQNMYNQNAYNHTPNTYNSSSMLPMQHFMNQNQPNQPPVFQPHNVALRHPNVNEPGN